MSESKLTINDLPSQMSQSSSKLLRISSAALVIPPLIYFNDTLISIHKAKNDHGYRFETEEFSSCNTNPKILPAFFHSTITANDLVDDNDRLGEDIDRKKRSEWMQQ